MRGKTGLAGAAAVAAALMFAAWGFADEPPTDCEPGQLTVSKETTYFTEPLREDGTVDYIAALNAKHSQGVTPENNAAVLLMRALGPHCFDDQSRDAFLEGLGIDKLPKEGDYLDASSEEHGLENSADWYAFTAKPWSARENPGLAAWLERNSEPLDMIKQATERSHYYMPLIAGDESETLQGSLLGPLGAYRLGVRALLARAMLRLDHGDAEAAWSDILACYRLSRALKQTSMMIEFLVGVAIERCADEATIALASSGQLPAERLRRCLNELAGLDPVPSKLKYIDISERCEVLDYITTFHRDPSYALEMVYQGIDHWGIPISSVRLKVE